MLLEKFQQVIRTQLRLAPGDRVVLGVSGGADSLCLLDLFARSGQPVLVAHLNHRLRPEAGQETQFVAGLARERGLPFTSREEDVAAYALQERLSIEDAARRLRYRFLFETARDHGAAAVAVAHQADDQVETVLMHLLRGSGLAGLAGMAYVTTNPAWDPKIPLLRPLLGFWRDEIEAFLRDRGITTFVEDESNRDTAYARNRIRHEIIPFLEARYPGVKERIHRLAGLAGEDEALLREITGQAWAGLLVDERDRRLILHMPGLRGQPAGIQRRLLREVYRRLTGSLLELDASDVQRALDFVQSGSRSGKLDWTAGLRLQLEGEQLWAFAPGADSGLPDWLQLHSPEELTLQVPGRIDLRAGWRLAAQIEEPPEGDLAAASEGGLHAWLDADCLTMPLVVRARRRGDRFQPLGMAEGSVKVSDFFTNQKLPRPARDTWPLVTAGEQIVWIPGFRPAHPVRVTPATRRVLHLWAARDAEE